MYKNNTDPSDEISMKDLLLKAKQLISYLFSNWFLILVITVSFALAGFFYAQAVKAKYIADTSFSLDEEKSSGGGSLLGLAASFGFDMGGGGNLFTNENILQLFTSKRIINAALLSKIDDDRKTHADQFLNISGLGKVLGLKDDLFSGVSEVKALSRFQDSVLNLLYKRIVTEDLTVSKPDKKVDIYHVIVKTTDEKLSKSFSRTMVDQVSLLYTEIKTTKAKQTVEILQRRVDSLRGSYNRALYGQASILDANLNPALRSVTVGAQQKQAEMTTSSAAYQELLKNLEMSKYALLKQSPLFQIIDEPRYPLEKLKPSRLIYGFIGGAIGFLLSAAFVLIRRFLNSL